MPSILIIDRNSVIKPYNTKTFVEDELYKKAGFKSKDGFAKHSEWTVSLKNAPSIIELYGKITGRAGQENKYDFPPPADNILFFGSCVLVCKSGKNVVDISLAEWAKVYEQLFGGFEDINASDSDEDDEDDDEDDGVPRTKEGYAKDGFIVDDTEESDESEYEPLVVVSSKSKSKSTKKPVVAKNSVDEVRLEASRVRGFAVEDLSSKANAKPPKKTKSTEKQSMKQDLAENIHIKIHPEVVAPVPTPIEDEFDPTYFSCTDELVEESYI